MSLPTRTVTRESIKVGFLDLQHNTFTAPVSQKIDLADLDVALEYTLMQVCSCMSLFNIKHFDSFLKLYRTSC